MKHSKPSPDPEVHNGVIMVALQTCFDLLLQLELQVVENMVHTKPTDNLVGTLQCPSLHQIYESHH